MESKAKSSRSMGVSPCTSLFIFVLVGIVTGKALAAMVPAELTALLAIQAGLTHGDPQWYVGSDCSQLYGVTCDSTGHVTKIDFTQFSFQAAGTLSPSIGLFPKLQILDLSQSLFEGPIPSSIGNLTSLTKLNLGGGNTFSGTIPPEIGNLKNLKILDLGYNSLSGVIPSTFGKLKSLVELRLYHNNLVGPIPASIGQLANLQYIGLFSNRLSGPIPSSIPQLKKLTNFEVEDNYLGGTFSLNCAKYKTCDVSLNCLKGALKQRTSSACISFCGANSAAGSCSGNGICDFNSQNKPVCTCNAGWKSSNCNTKVKGSPPPPKKNN